MLTMWISPQKQSKEGGDRNRNEFLKICHGIKELFYLFKSAIKFKSSIIKLNFIEDIVNCWGIWTF